MSNSAIAVIGETQISILFFNAQPVITLAMMDQVHGRPEGTARRNFNEHKDKLIADKDYFVRNSYEAKTEFGITAPKGLIILTETGYLLLVKSFADDLAWQVQRQLVKAYFKAKTEVAQLPEPKTKKALPGGLTLEQQDCIKALVKANAKRQTARCHHQLMGRYQAKIRLHLQSRQPVRIHQHHQPTLPLTAGRRTHAGSAQAR